MKSFANRAPDELLLALIETLNVFDVLPPDVTIADDDNDLEPNTAFKLIIN